MRNISDIYEFVRYIVRKQRGVFINTTDVCNNLDFGQMDAFYDYFNLYGVNQTIHDALRPFRVYQTFTSNASGGVSFQDDYLHMIGNPLIGSEDNLSNIRMINEDERGAALKSQLRPISATRPILVDSDTGFSIHPRQVITGVYTYLRRPAKPVYGYTQAGRQITYSDADSTQLEWNEQYVNNIIARSLKYAGVNIEDAGVLQFAEQYNAETK